MKRILLLILLLSTVTGYSQKLFLGVVKSSGPTCPFDITSWYGTTNWAESPTGTWGPASYPANGEAMANVGSIAGDGYIQSEYNSTANESSAIFLTTNENPTSPYYANVEYGLYVAATGNYSTAISGSFTDLGIAVNVGDLFRVIRTGTTVKAQYFRSAAWTDLFTYTTSSTGSLFMGCSSADPGVAKYFRNPKYCN